MVVLPVPGPPVITITLAASGLADGLQLAWHKRNRRMLARQGQGGIFIHR
jgi:hypothetical protein